MDARQDPPRILRIATAILLIGILATLLWLMIAPPPGYVHYQHWFQATFDLVMGIIFTSCGLFFDSWFARIMGADKAPVILSFGPTRARMSYIVIGLIFLVLGGVGFLLNII